MSISSKEDIGSPKRGPSVDRFLSLGGEVKTLGGTASMESQRLRLARRGTRSGADPEGLVQVSLEREGERARERFDCSTNTGLCWGYVLKDGG